MIFVLEIWTIQLNTYLLSRWLNRFFSFKSRFRITKWEYFQSSNERVCKFISWHRKMFFSTASPLFFPRNAQCGISQFGLNIATSWRLCREIRTCIFKYEICFTSQPYSTRAAKRWRRLWLYSFESSYKTIEQNNQLGYDKEMCRFHWIGVVKKLFLTWANIV